MEQTTGASTPFVLASVQMQRNSAAEVAHSDRPLREAVLEGCRRRNAVLDAIFYDVKVISAPETATLAPWLAHEGALLVVPPSGRGSLRVCAGLDDFAARGGARTRILTVAGVGSSALGTAAFARNVADAFDEPVGALVSGYGLADMLAEAAGGWFWFGALNRLRHLAEGFGDMLRASSFTAHYAGLMGMPGLAHLSCDTRTLCALLTDRRFRFDLLTGHSKGNLVISEALYALRDAQADGHLDLSIVTVSAAIAMPPRYRNIIDVMGDADWFGMLNSNLGIGVEYRLRDAGHHTNTELRWHLPVCEAMSAIRRERGSSLLH
ncbi:hypothetical protein [Massilia sp. SYSU DXS3249]